VIATHVAAGLAGAALAAVASWNIQAWRYDGQIAEREHQIAQAAQAAEAAARRRERELQTYADQISQDAARRQTVLAARVATTDRVAGQLRDDIARLNARPAPADPAAARVAVAAARVRELLGACAEEYRGVAVAADGLRDQVIGLQRFASSVATE
jgi:ABC-type transporter Mla subunit MlaD